MPLDARRVVLLPLMAVAVAVASAVLEATTSATTASSLASRQRPRDVDDAAGASPYTALPEAQVLQEALPLRADADSSEAPEDDAVGDEDDVDDEEYDEYEEEYEDDGDDGRRQDEQEDGEDDDDGLQDDYYEDDEVEDVPATAAGHDYGDDADDDDDDDDEIEGAGDGEMQARDEDAVEEVAADAVEDMDKAVAAERRAEVRSLSDLPLSKLLRVRSELRRLTSQENDKKDQCDNTSRRPQHSASAQPSASQRTSSDSPEERRASTSPNAQPLNWGGAGGGGRKGVSSSSRAPPIRRGDSGGGGGGSSMEGGGRGGWEEWEEEEDEGGWISWNKGKKKGKGDIGSIFQISVTFLAFLAFGGYLLCLIMHAIKGGGYNNGYPYYPYYGGQGQVRPANLMMVMMPTRLGNRRPTRPASSGAGRRRKRRSDSPEDGAERPWPSWWPPWSEANMRLVPEVDVDRMHRALLVLAEGYTSFYHQKYVRRQ